MQGRAMRVEQAEVVKLLTTRLVLGSGVPVRRLRRGAGVSHELGI